MKILKIFPLIIFLITFLPYDHLGQTVVLEKDRTAVIEADTPTFGVNRRHFVHQFLSLGLILPEENTVQTKFGPSLHFEYGVRYKLKLHNYFALGAEAAYSSLDYHLVQEAGKVVPDTALHDKEKLTFFTLRGGLFLRVSFDKRGNKMGKFLDIGGSYNYVLNSVHFMKSDLPSGEVEQTKIKKLDYTSSSFYHATARLGLNTVSIYGKYLLTPLINEQKKVTSLPKIIIGIQFGLH